MSQAVLSVELLQQEAVTFADVISTYPEPTLYGVTDGKAIGTYLEHKFCAHLDATFRFSHGNSASGIDFPELRVDMKVTAITQPQSSCPLNRRVRKSLVWGTLYCYSFTKKRMIRGQHSDPQHFAYHLCAEASHC